MIGMVAQTFDSALQRQEDDYKLKASLGYRINPYVKAKTKADKSTNQSSPRAKVQSGSE